MSILETVSDIYAAFGRGDVPFILEQLDEQVIWEENTEDYGIPWIIPGRGREVVGRFFTVLSEQMEMQRFNITGLCVGEHLVTALVDARIHVKATGKTYEDHEVHVWRFNEAGKVVAFRHVFDTHKHLAASKA